MTNNFENKKPKMRKIKRPKRRPDENVSAPKTENHNFRKQESRELSRTGGFNDLNTKEMFNIDKVLDTKDINSFITDEDIEKKNKPKFFIGNLFTLNFVILIGVATFFLSLLVGKIIFTNETVVRDGLQGVVMNPEIPTGRARCGKAERTQGCVLYVMNPQNQDLKARDFYDTAANMTGRHRFMIETANMRYSTISIKPGAIAQLNIPPLVN